MITKDIATTSLMHSPRGVSETPAACYWVDIMLNDYGRLMTPVVSWRFSGEEVEEEMEGCAVPPCVSLHPAVWAHASHPAVSSR